MSLFKMFDESERTPDPCANKHGGNEASKRAFESVSSGERAKQRKLILRLIRQAGEKGLTSADLEKMLNMAKHRFSGRLAEAKAAGLIRGTGIYRDHCEVLVSTTNEE